MEVERLNAGQPRPVGRITKLVAQKMADYLPEIVSRLGSKMFFHRGIHRCGQQGYDGELVRSSTKSRNNDRVGTSGKCTSPARRRRRHGNTGLWMAQGQIWVPLFVAGGGQLHSWSSGPPAELSRLGTFLEEISG